LFIFLLGCAFFAGGKAFVRTYWKPLALSFASFFWLFSPFLRFIILTPHDFFGRMEELNVFAEMARTGDSWLFLKKGLWTMLSFFWAPGVHEDFAVPPHPLVDSFLGLLLLAGLVLAFFGLRQRVNWAAIGGLVFGVLSNSVSISMPGVSQNPSYIHGHRMFFVLPFAMILATRGIEWFWEIFDKSGRRVKAGMRIAMASGLVYFFAFNIYIYYFKFGNRESVFETTGFHHVEQSKIVNRLKGECHLIFDTDSHTPIIDYFSDLSPENVIAYNNDLPLPIPNRVTKDVTIFTHPWKMVAAQEKIPKIYPHTVLTEYRNPWGNVHLRVYRIPRADIEAAQKGMKLAPPLP
jgi:hypothetical protein